MDDHSDLGFKPEAAANPHADIGFQPEQKAEAPGAMSQIGESLKNQAKGLFEAMHQAMTFPGGTLAPGQNPMAATMEDAQGRQQHGDAIAASQSDQWKKAKEHYDKGDYVQAIAHALPIVGPLVDKWQSGHKVEAATDVLAPVVMGAAAKGAAALGNRAAAPLYQSALKPGVADAPSLMDARTQVQTGLEHGIPVTEAGTNKLSALVNDYGKKVRDLVDQGAASGKTVDSNRVAARIQDARDRFASQVNPTKDLKAIDASRQEFLEQQGFQPGQPGQPPQPTGVLDASGQPVMTKGTPATPARKAQPIPVNVAQDLKVGTYQQVKAKYGEMGAAAVEAQKSLARGLKEELEAQIPELKGLNDQEGKLLDLQGSLERAVRRAGNHDLVGLGDAAVTGAGGVAGGPGGAAAAGFVKKILDVPGPKSKIAIALNKASGAGGKRIGYAAALGMVNSAIERMTAPESDQNNGAVEATTRWPY